MVKNTFKEKEPQKRLLKGIIQVTRSARGFMSFPEEEAHGKEYEDIEIQKEDLGGALNGDMVEVSLTTLYPRPKGRVIRVLTRAKDEFIATLERKDGKLVARPADQKFYQTMQLDVESPFAEGEKVLVKLLSFDGHVAKGSILKHLGRAGEHKVEMNAIVLEHGFSTEFPPAVTTEAEALERDHARIIEEESKHRLDFRGTPTMTIDPKDAKDFDDALSFVELPTGEYEIGVHIADATFFVREGTPLDDEAKRRGTSVYLVDSTIPMLPHQLSADICSLKENEDRLAFSAVFRINKKAEVLDRKFAKTIIRSSKRFVYEEAQKILDAGSGTFVKELQTLWSLAQIMRREREEDGAIDFGDHEVKFTLDENGKPLSVARKERINTNLLIEEFMLLANREVAAFITTLAEKIPEKNMISIYRIHDEPKPDRIEELATFVRAIGYEFGSKKQKKYSARDIRKLLQQIEGKPEASLIRTATLRSMAKAIYSTKNIGHFGLSFKFYTHFTSPIRRYPDMLVHRILFSHLSGKPMTRKEYSHLETMCIDASAREAEAVNAERESIRYKQVEFMMQKIGQTFEGTISGVTDWGLYVEEDESAAEGLVRVRTIGNDFYNYVAKDYSLVGQRTKKKYALGDRVRIKLIAADLASRQLDFELA